jgi:two-component system phosphate regulon response regulator PhoB
MARILVVEDDVDISRLLELRLRKAGHEVSSAPDGVIGLEAIRTAPPELVVLDWMMPRMNGLEVCAAVRDDEQLHELPILMLTAKTQPQDLDRALSSGADDYLMKPFESAEFLARVEALLQAHPAI